MGEPRWPTVVILRVGLAKKDKKCHPKKSFQPLLGQKEFSFGEQPLHTNNDELKSVPKSESVAGSASTSADFRQR